MRRYVTSFVTINLVKPIMRSPRLRFQSFHATSEGPRHFSRLERWVYASFYIHFDSKLALQKLHNHHQL